MASIKANVKHVKTMFNCTIEAIEHKQKDGYGNGVYLEMLKDGKRWEGMHWQDCRYMKGYELKKAVEMIIQDFYGSNLKALEFVEE